jgi:hypothetical protein
VLNMARGWGSTPIAEENPQPRPNGRRLVGEVHGRKGDLVTLNHRALMERRLDSRVQEESVSRAPPWIAIFLRSQVSVHLIKITALQTVPAEAPGGKYGSKFGVHYQPSLHVRGVQDDVSNHPGENGGNPL